MEGATIDILAGSTRSITFNFVLPEAHGAMTVVPSARIGPATWHVVGLSLIHISLGSELVTYPPKRCVNM